MRGISWPSVFCLCLLNHLHTALADEDYDDSSPLDDFAWLQGFSGLGPYLIGLFLLIFGIHLFIQPDWMLISLMENYLSSSTSVIGTVLHCEEKMGSSYLVEIMYEQKEHRFADNASLKFRFPHATEMRKFARRFKFERLLEHGDAVVMMIPSFNGTRSGYPRELVESTLRQLESKKQKRTIVFLSFSAASAFTLFLATRQLLLMSEQQYYGWMVLLGSLVVFESFSFLVCADQFMKNKRRTFDNVLPMINAGEQQKRREERAKDRHTVAPFSIPLNEFAGHARVTQRTR